jgi:hypothetical protein
LRRTALSLCCGLLLTACSDGSTPGDAEPSAAQARRLCLNSTCGVPRQLLDLPDLENLLVTDAGRLFLTGQQNVYEVHADGTGFRAESLFASGGGSGLAQAGRLLYLLHQDDAGGATDFSGVYALDLAQPGATPEKIFALTGMTLPNGLVAGPDHSLYLTDGPIALEPKIVRLVLDPADPRKVLRQETWLATLPEYPNGLAIRGNALYTTLYNPTTLTGTVARIDIQADGSPGPVVPLFTRGIMDDLNVYGDTLLVTDWQNSRVLQLALDGTLLQETDAFSFRQPSSVDVGQAPLFAMSVALVTERYTGRGLWVIEPR